MLTVPSQRKAWLDMVAWSELGPEIIAESDDGYNVLVGSTPQKLRLFYDYAQHPRIRYPKLNSDAAGRYQFMGRFWQHYKLFLSLPDFGHQSQDKWALWLVHECKALDDIDCGRIADAIHKCRSRWASFPGAGYGQHEHTSEELLTIFSHAGGIILPA
jgi:muramidase (phage lysozyme)